MDKPSLPSRRMKMTGRWALDMPQSNGAGGGAVCVVTEASETPALSWKAARSLIAGRDASPRFQKRGQDTC